VSGQLHAPAALPTGKKPPYPLDRTLDGPQSRSGRRGEKKILDPVGTRTPDSSAVQPAARRYTDRAIAAPTDTSKYSPRCSWVNAQPWHVRGTWSSLPCVPVEWSMYWYKASRFASAKDYLSCPMTRFTSFSLSISAFLPLGCSCQFHRFEALSARVV
jgi:hypothetical protein